MLSSRDGFCTVIVLDEHLPAYHTQQHTLQLQSLAHAIGPHQHSPAASFSPIAPTLPSQSISLKRSEPPTTSSSCDENIAGQSTMDKVAALGSLGAGDGGDTQHLEPPKKKRRVALTRVGDLDS